MVNRWVLEANTWSQGDLKLILNISGMTVTTIISATTIPSLSVYEEVIEEPIVIPPEPMINPGTILVSQTVPIGEIPAELVSGTPPSGNGTITYQWEEKT
jgi:hypothetical protein